MIAGDVDHTDAAAAREQSLITLSQLQVARTIGNDKYLEQRECADQRSSLPSSALLNKGEIKGRYL